MTKTALTLATAKAAYAKQLESASRVLGPLGACDIANEATRSDRSHWKPKRLIRLPQDMQRAAKQQAATLERHIDQSLAALALTEHRALTPPTVFNEVSHVSLSVHAASSVAKVSAEARLATLKSAQRFYKLATTQWTAQQQTTYDLPALLTAIARLKRTPAERLRTSKPTGFSYQLYIYFRDESFQRTNLNQMVIVIGHDRAVPQLFLQRPRKQRIDAKTRTPYFDFKGGTIVDPSGSTLSFPPVLYEKR